MDEPSGIPVRVVEYEVTNREGSDEIFFLITTIADPAEASGPELAAAYARLNPPRRHRSNPRVVKRVHVHGYKAKRDFGTSIVYDGPPSIKILAVT